MKINARIPKGLYNWIGSEYGNVSQAVNDGLELLVKSRSGGCDTLCDTTCDTIAHTSPQASSPESARQNVELSHELKAVLDSLKVAEHNYETQQARIEDLKAQIQTLYDQLHTKDEQIKDQNENMHKQAVHIQTLIQENSRLNVKLLPETTESNKAWWKFW
ncbi:MAG TPA: hypothetical protein VHP31_12345 [Caproicibacter sp.]|nr:hypothetical protein [Caproicibacter sp.]